MSDTTLANVTCLRIRSIGSPSVGRIALVNPPGPQSRECLRAKVSSRSGSRQEWSAHAWSCVFARRELKSSHAAGAERLLRPRERFRFGLLLLEPDHEAVVRESGRRGVVHLLDRDPSLPVIGVAVTEVLTLEDSHARDQVEAATRQVRGP